MLTPVIRVTLFAASFAVFAVAAGAQNPPTPPTPPIPRTGDTVPGFAPFENSIDALMRSHKIPGGTIAFVKEGRLVYARGFGYIDAEQKVQAEPASLFRIASVSKALTASAIMKLVESKKLSLDDKVFEWKDLESELGEARDLRLMSTTIRMLLEHTGGWDRDQTFDPMFIPARMADSLKLKRPVSAQSVIRYMMRQPLQAAPGAQYSYSNFGYTVLGRVIERVSGMPYDEFVRREILEPAGITGMRIASSRLEGRLPGEAKYYVTGQPLGLPKILSVFPREDSVPLAYGGFNIEAMDAAAGWVASVIDLAKFLTAVDGHASRPDVVADSALRAMIAPGGGRFVIRVFTERGGSVVSVINGQQTYRGALDGFIRAIGGSRSQLWHAGTLPGSQTLIAATNENTGWVALFNGAFDQSGCIRGCAG